MRNGREAPWAQRSVEQIYQKRTQLEHILLRPDSYVGSTERQSQEQQDCRGRFDFAFQSALDSASPALSARLLLLGAVVRF